MSQLRIPAVYMRGGTSKGVFFLAEDLPSDPQARDRILMRVIGSPDRYGKHTDGMGGATSSTSKVVILSKSARAAEEVVDVAIRAPPSRRRRQSPGPSCTVWRRSAPTAACASATRPAP
jgi:PrpF protein